MEKYYFIQYSADVLAASGSSLNLSDVAVVGRFADYKALGAVGSTTLLVTLFVGFLIGMGSGVNVRVAHALGAGKHKDTVETVHTALLLCMMMGLLIGAVCFFFSGLHAHAFAYKR